MTSTTRIVAGALVVLLAAAGGYYFLGNRGAAPAPQKAGAPPPPDVGVIEIKRADVPLTLQVWPHMIHAWHLWAAQLQDGRRAIADAGAFIRACL